MCNRERLLDEKRRMVLALTGWSVVMLIAMQAAAAPGPILLREQLNQTYGPELIGVPFNAGNKKCVVDGVQLTGPRGPVAVQLADAKFWPGDGKFVKAKPGASRIVLVRK